jgi:hypothetical protein
MKDDGGQAFPYRPAAHACDEAPPDVKGMTLRDYFAAAALQGMEANPACDEWLPEKLAQVAYEHADAMLKARSE